MYMMDWNLQVLDFLSVLTFNPLSSACDFKSHFCKQCELGPHCLPVCKNRFEKFARIFNRRHKQTTFSDAGFLGVLRVKVLSKIVADKIRNVLLLFFREDKMA